MSIYDPDALPFWENERGDGYWTRRRTFLAKRGVKMSHDFATEQPVSYQTPRDGTVWVSAPKPQRSGFFSRS